MHFECEICHIEGRRTFTMRRRRVESALRPDQPYVPAEPKKCKVPPSRVLCGGETGKAVRVQATATQFRCCPRNGKRVIRTTTPLGLTAWEGGTTSLRKPGDRPSHD